MIGEFLTATLKVSDKMENIPNQWMKFLFGHSSNSGKLSRQKFHIELACVFTAERYTRKNAD